MLEIQPVAEKSSQNAICDLCDVRYRPESQAYSVTLNGVPAGICQFRTHGKAAHIDDLHILSNTQGESEIKILLLRAVLNYLDFCSVTEVIWDAEDINVAKTLGFRKKKNTMTFDLLKHE